LNNKSQNNREEIVSGEVNTLNGGFALDADTKELQPQAVLFNRY